MELALQAVNAVALLQATRRAPQCPLLHTQLKPNTRRSAESCPYRAKLPGDDLTSHFMRGS